MARIALWLAASRWYFDGFDLCHVESFDQVGCGYLWLFLPPVIIILVAVGVGIRKAKKRRSHDR